jgi:hypothetical protein
MSLQGYYCTRCQRRLREYRNTCVVEMRLSQIVELDMLVWNFIEHSEVTFE